MTPEGKVKEKTKKFLKDAKAFYYMPVQNGMGVTGIPDLIACVPVEVTLDMVGSKIGVFVGIETKAPGKIKNTTANQRKNLEKIHNAFGAAVVVDDPELAKTHLEILEKGVIPYYVP